MPWPLWLSSDAFLAINQQRNILSSQRSSWSSTAWTKKQHWISTSHWIWQKESWISRSIGTRCCIGQQSKFFLRNSTKIECFESFTHQIKAITWIQTQINWMVFLSLFQLMSLRTTVKKQKLNPNADKIRPPPLISDFTSGVYFIDFFPLQMQNFITQQLFTIRSKCITMNNFIENSFYNTRGRCVYSVTQFHTDQFVCLFISLEITVFPNTKECSFSHKQILKRQNILFLFPSWT